MSEKKVLITGASGLLGRAILAYLTDSNLQEKYPVKDNSQFKWNCLGLCYSRVKENLKSIDLNNFEQVDALIDTFKPDVILHSAAEKRVENVEKDFEKANKLNKDVTEHLAQLSAKRGIFFVYISTDYVFDGKNPPYKIDAERNPLNRYGLSKMNGEIATLNASKANCVVRVPVLYGHTEPNRYDESAINSLIDKVKKGEPYQVDDFQVRYPTHCLDVARFLNRLMIRYYQETAKPNPIAGIFHCSALDAYTKYGMSCIMADAYGLSKEHIKPDLSSATITSGPNLRPKDVQLDTTYTYGLVDFQPMIHYKDAIKDCLDNFV